MYLPIEGLTIIAGKGGSASIASPTIASARFFVNAYVFGYFPKMLKNKFEINLQ